MRTRARSLALKCFFVSALIFCSDLAAQSIEGGTHQVASPQNIAGVLETLTKNNLLHVHHGFYYDRIRAAGKNLKLNGLFGNNALPDLERYALDAELGFVKKRRSIAYHNKTALKLDGLSRIKIRNMLCATNSFQIEIRGEIKEDRKGYLDGAFKIKSHDLSAALDAAVSAQIMTPEIAQLAKLYMFGAKALDILRGKKDAKPQKENQFRCTFKDRGIWLNDIKLASQQPYSLKNIASFLKITMPGSLHQEDQPMHAPIALKAH